jgi:hypothetical protein
MEGVLAGKSEGLPRFVDSRAELQHPPKEVEYAEFYTNVEESDTTGNGSKYKP